MVRIQLDFPDEQVKELDELMKQTNIVTRKDLFNNALTLFQWAVKNKRQGRMIASIDEKNGTSKELVMPALESAAVSPTIEKTILMAGSKEEAGTRDAVVG